MNTLRKEYDRLNNCSLSFDQHVQSIMQYGYCVCYNQFVRRKPAKKSELIKQPPVHVTKEELALLECDAETLWANTNDQAPTEITVDGLEEENMLEGCD